MRWDDDARVRDQYRTTANLATRSAVWSGTGPQDLVMDALRAASPR